MRRSGGDTPDSAVSQCDELLAFVCSLREQLGRAEAALRDVMSLCSERGEGLSLSILKAGCYQATERALKKNGAL